MAPEWQTEWLTPQQIPLANKFIGRCNFRGRVRPHDQCIVARNQSSDIIAVAALRPLEGFNLLTAVAVDPEYQGRGCASDLLTVMRRRFSEKTYTYALARLESFYVRIGFESVSESELPEHIRSRFLAYQRQRGNIIAMQFTL